MSKALIGQIILGLVLSFIDFNLSYAGCSDIKAQVPCNNRPGCHWKKAKFNPAGGKCRGSAAAEVQNAANAYNAQVEQGKKASYPCPTMGYTSALADATWKLDKSASLSRTAKNAVVSPAPDAQGNLTLTCEYEAGATAVFIAKKDTASSGASFVPKCTKEGIGFNCSWEYRP